mmetsp:Transcript_9851/g.28023  ORF Transcript_9851/g.28023 Transcript_9851/m.28023 type:complete len:559 (+) Transcript_9851:1017-2693(+)
MDVVHAAGVHDLLPADVAAGHLTHHVPELGHGPVVLGPSVKPHVLVGQVGVVRERLAVDVQEGTASDVLVRQGLPKALRRSGDGPLHQRVDLRQEPLPEVPSPLLQAVLLKVVELRDGVVELLGRAPVLPLQQGHDARDVLEVLLLQELLQEPPELAHADPAPLVPAVELPSQLLLELVHVVRLPGGDGLPEVVVRSEDGVPRDADPAAGHGGVEGGPPENGALKQLGGRPEEELHVGPPGELGDPRVELRGHDHGPLEHGVHLHHELPRGRVPPVGRVLQAKHDVLPLLHLGPHQGLHLPLRLLLGGVPPPRSRADQARRVDDRQVRAVLVLDPHHDLLGPKLVVLRLQPPVLALDVLLELLQGHLRLHRALHDQEAVGLHASRVVLHVKGDGPPGLRPTAHVVELEAHQRLHQGRLPVRLVAHDQNRWSIERLAKVLSQRVKLVVRFVQPLVPAAQERVVVVHHRGPVRSHAVAPVRAAEGRRRLSPLVHLHKVKRSGDVPVPLRASKLPVRRLLLLLLRRRLRRSSTAQALQPTLRGRDRHPRPKVVLQPPLLPS